MVRQGLLRWMGVLVCVNPSPVLIFMPILPIWFSLSMLISMQVLLNFVSVRTIQTRIHIKLMFEEKKMLINAVRNWEILHNFLPNNFSNYDFLNLIQLARYCTGPLLLQAWRLFHSYLVYIPQLISA